MFRSLILGCGIAALSIGVAQATLIDQPGEIYSHDNTQNLLWLDVTQTTNTSYNQIIAGAGGWLDAGWRYASRIEMTNLFETNLSSLTTSVRSSVNTLPGDFFADFQPDTAGEIAALLNTLGDTGSTDNGICLLCTVGVYDHVSMGTSHTGGGHLLGALLQVPISSDPNSGLWFVTQVGGQLDASHNISIGHFLVMDATSIPEPTTSLILIVGLLGLAGVRRYA